MKTTDFLIYYCPNFTSLIYFKVTQRSLRQSGILCTYHLSAGGCLSVPNSLVSASGYRIIKKNRIQSYPEYLSGYCLHLPSLLHFTKSEAALPLPTTRTRCRKHGDKQFVMGVSLNTPPCCNGDVTTLEFSSAFSDHDLDSKMICCC